MNIKYKITLDLETENKIENTDDKSIKRNVIHFLNEEINRMNKLSSENYKLVHVHIRITYWIENKYYYKTVLPTTYFKNDNIANYIKSFTSEIKRLNIGYSKLSKIHLHLAYA